MRALGAMSTLRFVVATSALAMLTASDATAQAVPTVAYPNSGVSLFSYVEERNLNEPVPVIIDVGPINIQEALVLAASRNADWALNVCGPPAPWTAVGTVVSVNGFNFLSTCTFKHINGGNILPPGHTTLDIASQERRVATVVVGTLIDNTAGSPGSVVIRGLTPGLAEITIGASDLDIARQELLASVRATGNRRYFAENEIFTGGGPVVTTDRVIAQSLTGRDTAVFVVTVVGPESAIVGTQTNCPSVASTIGCAGGVALDIPTGSVGIIGDTFQTLYITTTVERTLTGGVTFYDIPLIPLPSGVAHPEMQTVGLDLGDRFLRRLVSPGAAAFGTPLGSRGEAARWSIFLEGSGGRGRLSPNDRFNFSALRGGASRMIFPDLNLGLAFETGQWRLSHRDALVPERADGDTWRLGAFARYTPDRWRLNAAVIGGEQDVGSTGMSLAGGGTSRAKYKAKVWGAGVEAGYAISIDGFTLTPHARANVLRWSSPAFTESGGLAPLSVRKATREQTRFALGASLGRVYEIEPGLNLGLELGARVFTTVGDRSGHVIASDDVAPTSFAIDGPTSGRTGTELSAGVTLIKDDRMALSASYEGRFTGNDNTHAAMLTLKINF